MISYNKELWLHVPTRRAFVNITPQVEECLRESGIQEGLLLGNAMHISKMADMPLEVPSAVSVPSGAARRCSKLVTVGLGVRE